MTTQRAKQHKPSTSARICVIGSGTRFLSGISYYTLFLANALSSAHATSVILMRQLVPTRFYPGRERVGASITPMTYAQSVPVFDGVDWYWGLSMLRALLFLRRERPNIVVFQWWTGAVLHSYIFLALVARLLGARCVIEFHEVQDTGEARLPLVRPYVNLLMRTLLNVSSGYVIHSEFDRQELPRRFNLGNKPIALIPHGPYTQYQSSDSTSRRRDAPDDCCNLLFFGTIRPYKGLEDLLAAFEQIPREQIHQFWLTVVGETWEGWTLPTDMIAASRYRDRITFINRYVCDDEVAQFHAGADAVVLPYHRSSSSGPLHVAMSQGLPVVVTSVGGLTEAVREYAGATLVPAKDPAALQRALLTLPAIRGQRFSDPHSWQHTVDQYDKLLAMLDTTIRPIETANA